MKAIRRLTAITTLSLAGALAVPAQTFFSVNAGTDGFNVNLTNALPFFSPAVVVAPPPPRHVSIPLLPGLEYEYPVVVSPKHYKKAVKRYRKAIRHSGAGVVALPGGITVAIPFGGGGYYYDDDDDYEDWLEDQYKHHKKMSKRYKKAYKHYKHHHKHHHHDDDDDDD